MQVISGTQTANHLWDEASAYGDVLIEADNSWNVQTSYTLGNGEIIGQNRSSTLSYYLMDGHSGVRGLTDASGSLTDSYAYGAFGDLKNSTGTTANNYRYTGQQFDSLTGLYSLRARYYNPSEGRFLSRDTWQIDRLDPVELNRYSYIADNPINATDPSGYSAEYAIGQKPQEKSKPALFRLSKASIDTLTELAADFFISAAQDKFLELATDFLGNKFPPLAIVVGDATLEDGRVQKIMTLSDFHPGRTSHESYIASYRNAVEDFKRKYRQLGWIVRGGHFDRRATRDTVRHAEDYMEAAAKKIAPQLAPNSNIPSGVSQSKGICWRCQNKPGRKLFKSKIGIIINLAQEADLFIAGVRYGSPGRRG